MHFTSFEMWAGEDTEDSTRDQEADTDVRVFTREINHVFRRIGPRKMKTRKKKEELRSGCL